MNQRWQADRTPPAVIPSIARNLNRIHPDDNRRFGLLLFTVLLILYANSAIEPESKAASAFYTNGRCQVVQQMLGYTDKVMLYKLG